MSVNSQSTQLGVTTDIAVIDQFLSVEGKFLVDAGCGAMQLSKAFAKRGASVLAIDPDPIQAAKNKAADPIANVGFAERGADAIPVEPGSVDGVVFPYSMHHIPKQLYGDVLAEMRRVLKPHGFIYVMEPVADGALNEIIRLFHDEAAVRASAQDALDTLFKPCFEQSTQVDYCTEIRYQSWEEFATKYSNKSFNTHYTADQIRNETVRSTFTNLGEPVNYRFESPMRVTFLDGLKSV